MVPSHGNITCDVNRLHWQPGLLHLENMPLGQFHRIKQTQYLKENVTCIEYYTVYMIFL